MFISRNKKNNVYPCKPQFYYMTVGFKGRGGGQNYIVMFSWWSGVKLLHWKLRELYTPGRLSASLFVQGRYFLEISVCFPAHQVPSTIGSTLKGKNLLPEEAWNVKNCFLGKIRKNISKCPLQKFLPRMLSINSSPYLSSNLNKCLYSSKNCWPNGKLCRQWSKLLV